MNLIKDNKYLYNTLLKLAQTPGIAESTKLNVEVLNGLLSKLETDLSDLSDFSSSKPNVQVFSEDLQSVDQLFNFLSRNQVEYQNQRLAFSHSPTKENSVQQSSADDVSFQQLPQNLKLLYVKYPAVSGANTDDFNYYFNKAGIIVFIQDQYNQANKNDNGIHRAMLADLSKQLSNITGTKIDPDATEPAKVKTSIVDYIPKVIQGINDFSKGDTTMALSLDNLKDKGSFNNWLLSKTPKIKIKDEELDYQKGICGILSNLAKRAAQAERFAKPEDEANMKAYVQLVSKLQPSYGCPVDGNVGDGTDTPEQKQNRLLENIKNYLPFLDKVISTDAILKFLNAYEGVLGNSDEGSERKGNIDSIKNMIRGLKATLPMSTYNIEDSVQSAKTIMDALSEKYTNPGEEGFKKYNLHIAMLRKVVANTMALLTDLSHRYGNIGSAVNAVNNNIRVGQQNINDITGLQQNGPKIQGNF